MNKRFLLRQTTYSLSSKGYKKLEEFSKKDISSLSVLDREIYDGLSELESSDRLTDSKLEYKLYKKGYLEEEKTAGQRLDYLYKKDPKLAFALDTYLSIACGLPVEEKVLDESISILRSVKYPSYETKVRKLSTISDKRLFIDKVMSYLHYGADAGRNGVYHEKDFGHRQEVVPEVWKILAAISKATPITRNCFERVP